MTPLHRYVLSSTSIPVGDSIPGIEYGARYTHTYRDGRTIQVTNVHHEAPYDRAWALERVAEMVRAQEVCGRPVDAHLVTRRPATEWAPLTSDRLAPGQRDGWACILCGEQRTVDEPMVPAGTIPAEDGGAAWQVFRCVTCPSRDTVDLADEIAFPGAARMPDVPFSPATLTPKQRENLTTEQREGLACIRCGTQDNAMIPVGLLDGAQVYECAGERPTELTLTSLTVEQIRKADEVLQLVMFKGFRGPLSQADAVALFDLHLAIRAAL